MRTTYPKEKKKKKRHSRPLKRQVHIDGKEWRWEYDGGIKILSPENKYWHIGVCEFKGVEEILEDDFEFFQITPSEIKEYIQRNLV